jgi:hypothetical protein
MDELTVAAESILDGYVAITAPYKLRTAGASGRAV